MKRLPIVQFGNPVLRKKAEEISLQSLGDPYLKELIRQMFFTMRRTGGVGLAAPQVGFSQQLVVVEIKGSLLRPQITPLAPTVLINPKIFAVSTERLSDWEGCLSFPRVRGLVPRYQYITAKYFDQFGQEHVVNLEGLHARVFQHEIDHLNGALYIDRMDDLQSLMTLKEFQRQVSEKVLKNK